MRRFVWGGEGEGSSIRGWGRRDDRGKMLVARERRRGKWSVLFS